MPPDYRWFTSSCGSILATGDGKIMALERDSLIERPDTAEEEEEVVKEEEKIDVKGESDDVNVDAAAKEVVMEEADDRSKGQKGDQHCEEQPSSQTAAAAGDTSALLPDTISSATSMPAPPPEISSEPNSGEASSKPDQASSGGQLGDQPDPTPCVDDHPISSTELNDGAASENKGAGDIVGSEKTATATKATSPMQVVPAAPAALGDVDTMQQQPLPPSKRVRLVQEDGTRTKVDTSAVVDDAADDAANALSSRPVATIATESKQASTDVEGDPSDAKSAAAAAAPSSRGRRASSRTTRKRKAAS